MNEIIDRKPTLRFDYAGFSMGEQNKVENEKNENKQKDTTTVYVLPFEYST